MLTKEQASVAAGALVTEAEFNNTRRAMARLVRRAGQPPTGLSVAQFGELVREAERHAAFSWKFFCPLGASILLLAVLKYQHAPAALITGIVPAAVMLLYAIRRRLIQAYIRKAASTDA